MRIAIVGLGKLGSPLLAVAASAGHQVVGADLNPAYVAAINAGNPPVAEPGLAQLLSDRFEFIHATTNLAEAISDAELILVVVPTPSLPSGAFSCREVVTAMQQIGPSLSGEYPVVALVSTVMPGQCQAEIIPAVEAASGRSYGQDFGFCYNPTFIALGSVVHDLTHPDLVLIGRWDDRAADVVEIFHRSIYKTDPSLVRMSIINAEISKLALNTYVTTKISYANMLAMLCEKLPGADACVVCAAIGHDRRIGHHYLRPGTAYGGPCFPRDNRALLAAGGRAGVELALATATEQINASQSQQMADRVMALRKPGQRVGILGLAYKPGSPVCECSAAIELIHQLLQFTSIVVWDELALPTVEIMLGASVEYAESLTTCCRRADVIVVMLPEVVFRHLPPPELAGKVIIDAWGIVKNVGEFHPDTRYVRMGLGPQEETAQ